MMPPALDWGRPFFGAGFTSHIQANERSIEVPGQNTHNFGRRVPAKKKVTDKTVNTSMRRPLATTGRKARALSGWKV